LFVFFPFGIGFGLLFCFFEKFCFGMGCLCLLRWPVGPQLGNRGESRPKIQKKRRKHRDGYSRGRHFKPPHRLDSLQRTRSRSVIRHSLARQLASRQSQSCSPHATHIHCTASASLIQHAREADSHIAPSVHCFFTQCDARPISEGFGDDHHSTDVTGYSCDMLRTHRGLHTALATAQLSFTLHAPRSKLHQLLSTSSLLAPPAQLQKLQGFDSLLQTTFT
jgi:hypothetical protein